MNRRNHLTDQQVEQYAVNGPDATADDRGMERHVATCEQCRARVLEYERESLGVLEAGPAGLEPTGKCPSEEVLQEVAAGMCPPGAATGIMEHVADCRYCAPLMKLYLDVLEEPLPVPPSPVALNFLQHAISRLREILQSPGKLKLAWGGGLMALSVVLIVAGPTAVDAYKLNRAQTILAKAFVANRPNAMRTTWSPYAELDLKKGGQQCHANEEVSLDEARLIADREKDSPDPRWIRFRGRVQLLDCNQDAPQSLVNASEKGLNDPSTEIDLAVAYFQNAIQVHAASVEPGARSNSYAPGNSLPEFGQSLELLNKVLHEPQLSNEQRQVALFDLAIVYERMPFWDQAVATWEAYLNLDPVGPWHDEAQRHLDKAKDALRPAKPQGYRSPAFFLDNHDDPVVQASLEDYQDIALREWQFDDLNHPGSPVARALSELAELLEQRHGDPWMKDFLRAIRPTDLRGVRALGAAITNNKQGQYTAAREQAQNAAALFRNGPNYPGWLRAEVEGIYASQRLLGEKACLDQAQPAADQLLHAPYRWLRAQTTLTQAVCQNFKMNFDGALKQIELGRATAADGKFSMLQLRAQALEAAIWVPHDCSKTWQQIQHGLEQYWQGPSFPLRLYEFYSAAKLCFEKYQFWYAAEALEKQMLNILEREIDHNDENVALDVTGHRALAQILTELNDDKAAEDETMVAIGLLARVDKPTAASYEIPIKLQRATLQVDRGDLDGARETVQDAEAALPRTQASEGNHRNPDNKRFELNILAVRGDIELRTDQITEAERTFEDALVLAEEGLRQSGNDKQRRLWAQDTGDVYRGLVEVFLEQGRNQEALQLWGWYQERPFAPRAEPEPRSTEHRWENIEATILSQAIPTISDTRLIYVSTRNRLHIWKIGNTGIKSLWIPEKRDDLQRRVRRYLHEVGNPKSPDSPPPSDEDNKRLFSVLLEPVIMDLPASETVVLDLDRAIKGLPLEALKSPEGWYFGQKYPVIYSPGYIRENDFRKPPQQSPHRGFALKALDAKDEVDALRDSFPQMGVKYDEATTIADLQASLESAEMFAFTGHGRFGQLMHHNGEPLTAANFPPQIFKSLQVAVLSACSSGSTPTADTISEGLVDTQDLVEAFQAGRTPGVIASQWDVDRQSTTELMESFYTHLAHNESPAHALYEARKAMFPRYGDPYYWAGFVLYGRPD